MVTILTRKLVFPHATTANRDGLVAVGGDLSVERLLVAYRHGIFPWPIFDDHLMTWFSPDPRTILELDDLYVSRSLKKKIRKNAFHVTFDKAFPAVIRFCAESTTKRPTTWITRDMRRAYIELARRGHAHSVECWQSDVLVGGLYGVTVGGLFAGESMFSRVTDASKVALVHLVERLKERGYVLLDVQQDTPHMMSMGAKNMSRRHYLKRLSKALQHSCSFR